MFGRGERSTPFQREPLVKLEDLRDDCIALFLNSGLTQKEVHSRGGPTPGTISKWLYKETRFPRLDTIRGFLRAVGADIIIVDSVTAAQYRHKALHDRLNLDVRFAHKPRMPRKRAA